MGNMGNPQTWNPWIYAVNNPVRYKDASGYSPVEAWSDADWYSTIPGETKESSWAPDFIAYSIEEDAASGGKGFKANAAGAEYQETFLDWLDGATDNLMQTKAGDVMVYGDLMTVNFTIPGLMPSVYGWEMLVEGKTYEESTKEIQDFFRGYNKSMIKYIPETLYGMISIPESLWTVGESVSENGLLNTVKAMGSGIIDGITKTVRDDLVNGTAKSRGEIVGDCATFILEFVIGSKLLKDVITKNAVPDADDVSDALKGVADKTNDVLKGTENALKDNADDILQKTDDVLEHMDDVPEVKGKGMEDAAENLSGAVDDVVESGINSERIEYYLGKSRNNIDSDTVILGSTGKYDVIAETEGYTYFKMSDDVWASLEKEAGGNYDEIWKVNQQFIDEQIAANKNILLSNGPYKGYYFDDGTKRFYQREIDYILSKGYTFESTGDDLWKAVRK